MSGVYRVPSAAKRAVVELHFRWAPGGRVEWARVSLDQTTPPGPRKVRLATVHFMPGGHKSPAENCRMYAPMIEQAAKEKADLVVLGETITYAGTGLKMVDVAEPAPGPSTEYFGSLAKQNNLYIAVGLVERDGRLVYNTCALVARTRPGLARRRARPWHPVVVHLFREYRAVNCRHPQTGADQCSTNSMRRASRCGNSGGKPNCFSGSACL